MLCMLGYQHISRYVRVKMLEVAVIPADGFVHSRRHEGTGSSNDTLTGPPYETRSQQHSTASMCNEADCSTPNYQTFYHWQSRSIYQNGATDMPGPDMSDVESWDISQGYDLTVWDNALAGVGEHLADHKYQGYTNHGELVVD
jgi:hypothetical protein